MGDTSEEIQEKRGAVSSRIAAMLKTRPIMRLFNEVDGFMLRYGHGSEIDGRLNRTMPYDEALEADDDALREFIHKATPCREQLQSDIERYTEKKNALTKLLHQAVDNHYWYEVDELSSKAKWVIKDLKSLMVTLRQVV